MPGLTLSARTLSLSFLTALVLASPSSASVVRTFTFSAADLQVGVEEHGYATYSLRGGASWGEVGGPELPGLSVLIDLPEGMRATSVRAVASGFVAVGTGARPKPVQPPTPGIERPVWRDADPTRYANNAWSPVRAAELGPSGSLRGRSLASVVLLPLQISPLTGQARLATRIEVTVETSFASDRVARRRVIPEWEETVQRGFDASLKQGPAALRQGLEPSRSWQSRTLAPEARLEPQTVASDGLPKPFAPSALPSVVGSPVQYLIITNENMKATFQTLADWKTEQGCPAAVRTVEFINQNYPFGFDLADRIRRFVRDAYTQWGTVWVLLGGDTPVIPARYARTTFFGGENLATELYYSDLDGNWDADGDSLFGEGFVDSAHAGDNLDLLPDVYVGRAPVETISEATLFVNKVINYHQSPASGYLCKALYFSEVLFPQDWVPGQAIASDGATISEHAISRLTGCIAPTRLYENYTAYPGALPLTKRAVVDSINAGYNVLHHIGHGYRNTMSCGDASLTNPDVTPLHNSPKNAGLLYAIDCTSAAFDFESIGEEFVLAQNGGSINDIGSTHFDFPATGDGYQNQFYDLVFQDGITQIGEAQALQKLPFVGFSSYDNVQRWTQMTVLMLGDPELALWTEQPVALTVTVGSPVTVRDTSVTVTVQRLGSPAVGAKVCLMKGSEDYRVGTTDATGRVVLSFRPESQGVAKVTVTFRNSIPYRGTFTILSSSGVALVTRPQDRVVNDSGVGTNGNADGVLDAGERVDLTVPVKNLGGVSSGAVSGTLMSLDTRATVLVSAGTYGTIAAGGTANGTAYRIELARTTLKDGDEVRLRLALSDGVTQWREDQFLTVRAPDLRQIKHVLNDGGAGNGDQVLDIGETADYTVTLSNLADGSGRSVSATLTAASPGVTVLDGGSWFGAIPPRSRMTGDVFRIRNDSAASPLFTLTVSDAYATLFTRTIDFQAPQAPTGVVGEGSATSVSLVWAMSSSADLDGYNVYRSQSQSGPFAKRDSIPPGRVAFFQDEGLAALTRYYYYVTSVDSSANESAPSPVISASTNPPMLNGFPIPMGRTTPSSPAIGDLERDGTLEAVVGSDYLYAWHADGQGVRDADGSERTSGDFTTQGSYFASAPAITDLDHDGVMDIVALSWESKQLFVFEPDGSMKAGFPITLLDAVWSSPACGDVDGDGFEEIVFNSNGSRFYAFRYNGTELRDGDSNPATLGVFAVLGATDNYGSPALADLDGDGKLDIIAPSRDGRIYAWKWDGTNVPGFPYGVFSAFVGSPAVGDIDNDGLLEIVCPAENNRLHCVKQNGLSQPGFPVLGMPSSGTSRAPSPALADMDGNGTREIVCAGTDGLLRILRTDGSFYPGWSGVRYSAKTAGASESSPVVADIEGDGHLDILIGSEDAQLYGFKDDGSPLAGFPIRLDGEVRGTPVIWDFNQDGDAEILLAGWDKNFYVWTYPGSYLPRPNREWVMFRHDGKRSGRLGTEIVVDVASVASAQMEAIDGGLRLRWKLPADAMAERARWRAFRTDGSVSGAALRIPAVPEGYRGVGLPVEAGDGGWVTIEDYAVTPGASYGYVLARVESAPGTAPLAFGPYGVLAPSSAPASAYLAGAYPNPGGGEQTLAYGLPDGLPPGTVARLDLYDLRGAYVRKLVHSEAASGRFVARWDGRADDGRAVAAGIYLYRLTAGPYTLGGRLVRLTP